MTSRRAQRRDGTRKSRQVDSPHKAVILAEYAAAREAWAKAGPFRPVNPPSPPVDFTDRERAA